MLKKILVIAGTHGVEPQSRDFAHKLIEELQKFSFKNIGSQTSSGKPFEVVSLKKSEQEIVFIPNLNQWGLEKNSRTNKNGVDLNRNMPAKNWSKDFEYPAYNPGPKPASEAEIQALLEIILDKNKIVFDLILSLHTTHFVHYHTPPQVNLDAKKTGEGYEFAKKLAEMMGLPLTDDFDHPCRGSLGSFCRDHDVPCITIELEEELSSEELWQKYSKAFCKSLCV